MKVLAVFGLILAMACALLPGSAGIQAGLGRFSGSNSEAATTSTGSSDIFAARGGRFGRSPRIGYALNRRPLGLHGGHGGLSGVFGGGTATSSASAQASASAHGGGFGGASAGASASANAKPAVFG